jgi:membrane fusion protein (multidrug efflux system)
MNLHPPQHSALKHVPRLCTLAIGLAAMAVGSTSCKKPTPPPLPPPIVQVLELTTTNVPLTAEFIGQLDSPQNVQVRARVEAFVDDMPFTEGTNVNQGDLLVQLDKKPFKQRLAAANGMLAEANAALNKYKADVARLTPLAKAKAIPLQDLDNAIASVEVGKASVQSAEARVQSALIDLGYCDVTAPVSGLIGARMVAIGDLVGRGEPTLLATISVLDPIWFYCNVAEAQFLRADSEPRRTGRKLDDLSLTLILANGETHKAPGKFVFVDRALDTKTGTMRVRAAFPNPDQILRPGMFGRIVVDAGVRSNSIVVPERAITELQGKNFAWVVGADNKPVQHEVKLGETLGANVVVLEGLKAGDRIVVEGLQKLRKDAPVQPMTAAQLAEAAAQAAKQAEAKPAGEGEAKHGKE